MAKRSPGHSSGFLGLIVVGTLGVFAFGVELERVNQTCTVGVTGTNLQVTAQGGGAPEFCQGSLTYTNFYQTDQPNPAGVVICRYDLNGSPWLGGADVTVRDQGVFMIYGTEMCKSLAPNAGGP